ncbi:MAG TPA: DNA translocase FtsK 4TM domain-containing protein, partial [Thermomicrobiales bacterium]|nr:DNA translocase FtsK 4TM domain-containing protein [Thermomicrobiales bacterium]
MATQSRAQGTGKKSTRRRTSKKTQATGLSLWALRMREFLSGMFPHVAVSDRLKREMLGVAMVLLALVSSWALGRGQDDGALIAGWERVLTGTLGRGAFLVPVFAALTAVRAFAQTDDPIVLFRHYIGGAIFTISVTGLLSFGGNAMGGNIGSVAGDIARGALGQVASGLLLFGVGVVSVFLLADTDIQTLDRDIRRLLPKRAPKPKKAAPEPEPAPRSIRKAKAKPAPAPKKEVRREDQPRPVINLPAVPDRAPVLGTATAQPLPIEVGPAHDADKPLPLPDLTKLPYYEAVTPDAGDLEMKARIIEETLESFKVDASVREINPGPAVTQFTLEPGNGVKVRRITELQNDLALSLAAQSIRVEAPIPGLARIGIEIPNPKIATVGLREVLESPEFQKSKAKLPLPLGRDVNGRYIVGDLTKMPHLLIAGATGSGKSVCINGIISTLISMKQPDEVRLLMIDPKMVELTGYNGVPHLQCPVVTEMDKVVGALRMVLREMNRRYELFKDIGVRNLQGYRHKTEDEPDAERLPYFVVIIDELADLM